MIGSDARRGDARYGERLVKTDERLIHRIARQDQTAFRELYERHADRVFRFALSHVGDRNLAEEVLQETMIAVWKGAARFRGDSKVTTWLLGIARNQAHSLLRQESRAGRTPALQAWTDDPHEAAAIQVRVERALATLPARQRELLHLVFYEQLSVAETADVLGIPEGTVKSRMFHARKALAKELRG